ncbi:ATP-dependent Clp protease proteolytic subunit, partial [Oenococcus oeni]
RLNNILKENSGKPIEKIEKDTERDHWMDSKETLDYGLIDKILINKEKNKS